MFVTPFGAQMSGLVILTVSFNHWTSGPLSSSVPIIHEVKAKKEETSESWDSIHFNYSQTHNFAGKIVSQQLSAVKLKSVLKKYLAKHGYGHLFFQRSKHSEGKGSGNAAGCLSCGLRGPGPLSWLHLRAAAPGSQRRKPQQLPQGARSGMQPVFAAYGSYFSSV